MTPSAWIAIASIGVAAAFSLIGLALQAFAAAFQFGRQAQRLAAVEERCRGAEENAASLAVLNATVAGIDKRLQDVAHDVKNLLTGRVRPPSR